MGDSDQDKQMGNTDKREREGERERIWRQDIFTRILISLERSKNTLHPLNKDIPSKKNKQNKKEPWLKKKMIAKRKKKNFRI